MKETLINIYTEYFYPEPASTGQLMTELARGLSKNDWEVRAVTTQPTYQGQEKAKLSKRGKLGEVSIVRTYGTQFDKEKLPLRLINWLSFTISAFFFSLFNNEEKEKVSLYLSNPPILPIVGLFLKWIKRDKYVVLLHDIYPDMAVELSLISRSNLLVWMWNKVNAAIYNHADKIVVLGEAMKKTLLAKKIYSLSEQKIEVMHNWENPDFIIPQDKANNPFAVEHGYDKEFTVLYSGNLGQHHDLTTIIEAADLLDELPVRFVFIGEGAQKTKLENMVQEKELNNVDFHPYQPKEKLPHTLTCGDVSVVSEDKRAEGLCVSSKLYSSLAAGQAILGLVGENSDVAHVIDNGDCGLRADQGDEEGVARHIEFWLDNDQELRRMGENARKHFERYFTLEHAIERYSNLLDEVINR